MIASKKLITVSLMGLILQGCDNSRTENETPTQLLAQDSHAPKINATLIQIKNDYKIMQAALTARQRQALTRLVNDFQFFGSLDAPWAESTQPEMSWKDFLAEHENDAQVLKLKAQVAFLFAISPSLNGLFDDLDALNQWQTTSFDELSMTQVTAAVQEFYRIKAKYLAKLNQQIKQSTQIDAILLAIETNDWTAFKEPSDLVVFLQANQLHLYAISNTAEVLAQLQQESEQAKENIQTLQTKQAKITEELAALARRTSALESDNRAFEVQFKTVTASIESAAKKSGESFTQINALHQTLQTTFTAFELQVAKDYQAAIDTANAITLTNITAIKTQVEGVQSQVNKEFQNAVTARQQMSVRLEGLIAQAKAEITSKLKELEAEDTTQAGAIQVLKDFQAETLEALNVLKINFEANTSQIAAIAAAQKLFEKANTSIATHLGELDAADDRLSNNLERIEASLTLGQTEFSDYKTTLKTKLKALQADLTKAYQDADQEASQTLSQLVEHFGTQSDTKINALKDAFEVSLNTQKETLLQAISKAENSFEAAQADFTTKLENLEGLSEDQAKSITKLTNQHATLLSKMEANFLKQAKKLETFHQKVALLFDQIKGLAKHQGDFDVLLDELSEQQLINKTHITALQDALNSHQESVAKQIQALTDDLETIKRLNLEQFLQKHKEQFKQLETAQNALDKRVQTLETAMEAAKQFQIQTNARLDQIELDLETTQAKLKSDVNTLTTALEDKVSTATLEKLQALVDKQGTVLANQTKLFDTLESTLYKILNHRLAGLVRQISEGVTERDQLSKKLKHLRCNSLRYFVKVDELLALSKIPTAAQYLETMDNFQDGL
jgi:chromosome segregation ATPase